jgi:carboxypeptidase Taq
MKAAPGDLTERMREIHELGSIAALLAWDQEAMMPSGAAASRAAQLGRMARIRHARLTDPALRRSISACAASGSRLSPRMRALLRDAERMARRARRIPAAVDEELARLSVIAHREWIVAKERDDFRLIRKRLERIVTLKRRVADAVGYDGEPYDALLDEYEPGMTAKRLDAIFGELGAGSQSILSEIRGGRTTIPASRLMEIRRRLRTADVATKRESLRAFCGEILTEMGFVADRGRLDTAYHPFVQGIHPDDVRVTIRLDRDLLDGVFSTLHEGGHALYEQGLPVSDWGTPLCEAVSLGVHESQSRTWENIVGRSSHFWRHWLPRLRRAFPEALKGVTREEWMGVVQEVKPIFIRVDSDEVTYNLHIILRYELERAMIAGGLKVKDLPEAWKARMKRDLNLVPRGDAEGCLQDVHWYAGIIGYFPTYALGNCYAAQLRAAFLRAVPDWDDRLAGGETKALREWQRRHVHRLGALYPAEELMRRVTGESVSARPLLRYLEEKFGVILAV